MKYMVSSIFYKEYINVNTKIFLDCDDTIINSSKCIIDLLNKKNSSNKTIDDLSDFYYRSIDPNISSNDIIKLFESDEFWNSVQYNFDFLIYKEFINNNFDVEIVSCGTKLNLEKKKKYIKDVGYKFTGILMNDNTSLCKSCVNMQGGIQIDDNIRSIENTNAAIKILLKNEHNFPWNNPKPNIDNLYVVQNWKEIYQILEFFNKNPEFVCKEH